MKRDRSQTTRSSNRLLVNPDQDLFRWKVDAYPSLVYAVCRDMTKSPYGWPKSEGFFFGHDFYWYDNWSVIWAHGDKFIAKYLKHSRGRLPAERIRRYGAAFKSLRRLVARSAKANYAQLELPALRRQWFAFFKTYAHFWLVITDIEVLNYAASRRLEKLIAQRRIKLSPDEISQLTAFPQRSYILEEEYELLKIAFALSASRRPAALRRHASKFSWILNGYHGVRPATAKFFVDRLRRFLTDRQAREHYQQLKDYYRLTERKFKQIVKQHNLDSEIVKYARLAQQASFIQDRRKALAWRATTYIIALYRRLAQQLDCNLEQALYILWDEFDTAVKNPGTMLKEVARRQKCSRLRIWGDRTTISTKDVARIFAVFEKQYVAALGQEVKGTIAYTGRVVGRVQIISGGKDISRFQPGRILVALMTSPDYIAAIKKAKAIVTDDGGLTCHAAIVARELKKPCIVGTRNATKVLHDGDLVEVDANHGIVKVISQ
ncbi:MAG: PEP-utilizing enzyme [Patescibacteria group bacterium]